MDYQNGPTGAERLQNTAVGLQYASSVITAIAIAIDIEAIDNSLTIDRHHQNVINARLISIPIPNSISPSKPFAPLMHPTAVRASFLEALALALAIAIATRPNHPLARTVCVWGDSKSVWRIRFCTACEPFHPFGRSLRQL